MPWCDGGGATEIGVAQIANEHRLMGVTKQRVMKIEKQALEKLGFFFCKHPDKLQKN